MQCLTHVLRLGVLFAAMAVSTLTYGVQADTVDEIYCDGLALMAKAGVEARQRGESLPKWRHNLLAMKGYGVRNKDNVLYRVLPQVIDEADRVYQTRQTPTETYVSSFNSCMSKDYGRLISAN